jgi:hypothetical protein
MAVWSSVALVFVAGAACARQKRQAAETKEPPPAVLSKGKTGGAASLVSWPGFEHVPASAVLVAAIDAAELLSHKTWTARFAGVARALESPTFAGSPRLIFFAADDRGSGSARVAVLAATRARVAQTPEASVPSAITATPSPVGARSWRAASGSAFVVGDPSLVAEAAAASGPGSSLSRARGEAWARLSAVLERLPKSAAFRAAARASRTLDRVREALWGEGPEQGPSVSDALARARAAGLAIVLRRESARLSIVVDLGDDQAATHLRDALRAGLRAYTGAARPSAPPAERFWRTLFGTPTLHVNEGFVIAESDVPLEVLAAVLRAS